MHLAPREPVNGDVAALVRHNRAVLDAQASRLRALDDQEWARLQRVHQAAVEEAVRDARDARDDRAVGWFLAFLVFGCCALMLLACVAWMTGRWDWAF